MILLFFCLFFEDSQRPTTWGAPVFLCTRASQGNQSLDKADTHEVEDEFQQPSGLAICSLFPPSEKSMPSDSAHPYVFMCAGRFSENY